MNELLTSKPVCRVDLLMNKLKDFYKNEKHIDTLINIVSGNSEIALRDIDWLCTNYSKKYNVIYNIKEEKNDEIINKRFILYINYRSQLKAYTKEFFDPFCRRDRIEFVYKDNKSLITTVGQLNFFRWALTYKVIDYALNNLKDIKKDNNSVIKKKKLIEENNNKQIDNKDISQDNVLDNNKDYNKDNDKNKHLSNESVGSNEKKRRKRHQLSISAVRTINKQNVSIIVNFESKSKTETDKNNNKSSSYSIDNNVNNDIDKKNENMIKNIEKNIKIDNTLEFIEDEKNVKIKQLSLKDKININRNKNKKNKDKKIKEKEEKSLIDYYCKKVVPTTVLQNQLFS